PVVSGNVVKAFGCTTRDFTPSLEPQKPLVALPVNASTATRADERAFWDDLTRILAERPDAVLSIDFWDTLVTRECHPDEVKLHGALTLLHRYGAMARGRFSDPWTVFAERQRIERQLGAARRSMGEDDEYAIGDVYDHLVRTVLAPLPDSRLGE